MKLGLAYTTVSSDVLSLTGRSLKVYIFLAIACRGTKHHILPISIEELSEECDITRKTTSAALLELEEAGLILRNHRRDSVQVVPLKASKKDGYIKKVYWDRRISRKKWFDLKAEFRDLEHEELDLPEEADSPDFGDEIEGDLEAPVDTQNGPNLGDSEKGRWVKITHSMGKNYPLSGEKLPMPPYRKTPLLHKKEGTAISLPVPRGEKKDMKKDLKSQGDLLSRKTQENREEIKKKKSIRQKSRPQVPRSLEKPTLKYSNSRMAEYLRDAYEEKYSNEDIPSSLFSSRKELGQLKNLYKRIFAELSLTGAEDSEIDREVEREMKKYIDFTFEHWEDLRAHFKLNSRLSPGLLLGFHKSFDLIMSGKEVLPRRGSISLNTGKATKSDPKDYPMEKILRDLSHLERRAEANGDWTPVEAHKARYGLDSSSEEVS